MNTKKPSKRNGMKWMIGGLLLLAAAFLLISYNLWEGQQAGDAAGKVLDELTQAMKQQSENIPDYLEHPEMEMPTLEVEGNQYIGTLEIPALGLTLPVMSQWSYPKLRIAPCRYAGSAYQEGFVIAAHNYSSHFGNLNQLSSGDRIYFTDVTGNRFSYQVAEVEELNPTALEEMVSEGWDLSLFTCTLSGQARVTVRCERMVGE